MQQASRYPASAVLHTCNTVPLLSLQSGMIMAWHRSRSPASHLGIALVRDVDLQEVRLRSDDIVGARGGGVGFQPRQPHRVHVECPDPAGASEQGCKSHRLALQLIPASHQVVVIWQAQSAVHRVRVTRHVCFVAQTVESTKTWWQDQTLSSSGCKVREFSAPATCREGVCSGKG